MTENSAPEAFGEAFFKRFYLSRKTRVAAPEEYLARARLLRAVADLFGCKVQRILDAGAGTGLFLQTLSGAFPRARCHGIEISRYACAQYGWQQASLIDYAPRARFDLVVCHDVLQYISPKDAPRAIDNLAALTTHLLYFTALTQEDWEQHCDQSRTDRNVTLRRARWYRARLRVHFRRVGPGIYFKRDTVPVMYALDEE